MKRVTQRRRGRNSFNLDAKRRNEIERLARHVGAADTEDFDLYLIAWYWHNPQSADPLWSLMYAAGRMGRQITVAEASAITEEASIMRRYRKADPLARFLGVTYALRQELGLRTIGSKDVGKRSRTVLRKRRAAKRQEARRRANGARPRAEYEANSLSATQPWRKLGMSRRTWERRRNKARDASPCAMSFSLPTHTLASRQVEPKRVAKAAAPPKQERGLASSRTATIGVVDAYASLPMELRLMALGLPLPEEYRAAA